LKKLLFILFLSPYLSYGQVIDANGKAYKTVKIGDQEWMAENLAFRPSSGKYWSYNKSKSNVTKYGYLYDWETSQNVCPAGWHLPSDEEWTVLTDFLGGNEKAGIKMKSTSGWDKYKTILEKPCSNCKDWNLEDLGKETCNECKNTRKSGEKSKKTFQSGNGSNSSGFSGLPSGDRGDNGCFGGIGSNGLWWSATEDGPVNAKSRHLSCKSEDVYKHSSYKIFGLSVRCLKD